MATPRQKKLRRRPKAPSPPPLRRANKESVEQWLTSYWTAWVSAVESSFAQVSRAKFPYWRPEFPHLTVVSCRGGVVVLVEEPYSDQLVIDWLESDAPVHVEATYRASNAFGVFDASRQGRRTSGWGKKKVKPQWLNPPVHPFSREPLPKLKIDPPPVRAALVGGYIDGEWALTMYGIGIEKNGARLSLFCFDDLWVSGVSPWSDSCGSDDAISFIQAIEANHALPKEERLSDSEVSRERSSALPAIVQKIADARIRFTALLDDYKHETELTDFIFRYPFLLRPGSRLVRKEQKINDGERRPDLAFEFSVPPHLLLIELEPARVQLLTLEGDHALAITKAMRQIAQWTQIQGEMGQALTAELEGYGFIHAAEIRYCIVIGRRDKLYGDKKLNDEVGLRGWSRIRQQLATQTELLTYDDLIDGCIQHETQLTALGAD